MGASWGFRRAVGGKGRRRIPTGCGAAPAYLMVVTDGVSRGMETRRDGTTAGVRAGWKRLVTSLWGVPPRSGPPGKDEAGPGECWFRRFAIPRHWPGEHPLAEGPRQRRGRAARTLMM